MATHGLFRVDFLLLEFDGKGSSSADAGFRKGFACTSEKKVRSEVDGWNRYSGRFTRNYRVSVQM
ncbi:expressed unknown protein [Ectocarpus siliculosus]|uniref:Uncharacterized protein n=1 Tax=Ectocarpus siliculosus TaxID=2880 RepID=D8LNE2_ECTSI|nr:expressed unknown protein [Ectocarpus siliculosus]|eukprot:CBN77299.1 expressed unknown protein [Ectocarpus siliculosus]